jgi:hypothetical protein
VARHRVAVLSQWTKSSFLPFATLMVGRDALTLERARRPPIARQRSEIDVVRIERYPLLLPCEIDVLPDGFGRRVVCWSMRRLVEDLNACDWPTGVFPEARGAA